MLRTFKAKDLRRLIGDLEDITRFAITVCDEGLLDEIVQSMATMHATITSILEQLDEDGSITIARIRRDN